MDDIIVYTSRRSLDLDIKLLNNDLENISVALKNMYFAVAPNKSKFTVITRRRITMMLNI